MNKLLVDILLNLRQRLVDSTQTGDRATLGELKITFMILREASYSTGSERLTIILTDLDSSALEASMGVPWKAPVLSENEIRKLLA